jgi:hypothetical protein
MHLQYYPLENAFLFCGWFSKGSGISVCGDSYLTANLIVEQNPVPDGDTGIPGSVALFAEYHTPTLPPTALPGAGSSSAGLTNGVIAAVAVCSAVAGVLIALAVVYLWHWRRGAGADAGAWAKRSVVSDDLEVNETGEWRPVPTDSVRLSAATAGGNGGERPRESKDTHAVVGSERVSEAKQSALHTSLVHSHSHSQNTLSRSLRTSQAVATGAETGPTGVSSDGQLLGRESMSVLSGHKRVVTAKEMREQAQEEMQMQMQSL